MDVRKQEPDMNNFPNGPIDWVEISDFTDVIMINPRITAKRKAYKTEEGCLSLIGVRKTTRYEEIEVEYEDMNFKKQKGKYSGWTAQIIQHECDHLEGIVI